MNIFTFGDQNQSSFFPTGSHRGLPNRFAEWSTACLEMELEELTKDTYTGPSVHYMGVFLEDDVAQARTLEGSVAGKLMASWWDTSTAAGDQRRPRSAFSEPIPTLDVLSIVDNKCKNLRLKLRQSLGICYIIVFKAHVPILPGVQSHPGFLTW